MKSLYEILESSPWQATQKAALRAQLTFGPTQGHGERAVALVQLSEAGTASMVPDHRQLLQDQSLGRGGQEGRKCRPWEAMLWLDRSQSFHLTFIENSWVRFPIGEVSWALITKRPKLHKGLSSVEFSKSVTSYSWSSLYKWSCALLSMWQHLNIALCEHMAL